MQIRDALEHYVVQLEADGRSTHTIGQYRRHVAVLASWLEARDRRSAVGDIDHEDLALFLASPDAAERPDGRAKKAASMNALRSSLRTFFSYVHAAGYAQTNPARLVRRARCGTPPPRALSDDERARLLASLATAKRPEEKRDCALFRLMLETGVRLGSALGLAVEDLDLDRGEIHLRHAKGNRPETVFMPRALADHLRGFVGDAASGALFVGRHGRGICARHVQRRLELWLRRAGIRRHATPHSLRHTFATGLYRQTGDVLLVMEALHHRSIASTMIYARADRAELRRALA